MRYTRIHAWRVQCEGRLVLFRTEYRNDDSLLVEFPSDSSWNIVVPPGEDDVEQVRAAAAAVRDEVNAEPRGCYNCLFFCRSGMQVDAGGTMGYCLDGRMGQNVRPNYDSTTMTDSCEGHVLATPEVQARTADAWAASIGK